MIDHLGIMIDHKCQRRVQVGIVLEMGRTWLGTVMSLSARGIAALLPLFAEI